MSGNNLNTENVGKILFIAQFTIRKHSKSKCEKDRKGRKQNLNFAS
jgi:hypothetical protein